jgi:hypothetical protein
MPEGAWLRVWLPKIGEIQEQESGCELQLEDHRGRPRHPQLLVTGSTGAPVALRVAW